MAPEHSSLCHRISLQLRFRVCAPHVEVNHRLGPRHVETDRGNFWPVEAFREVSQCELDISAPWKCYEFVVARNSLGGAISPPSR